MNVSLNQTYIENSIINILSANGYSLNEDGIIEIEVYSNFETKLPNDILSKILQSNDPENKFYEIFYDKFYEFEYISCLTECIKNDCPEFYDDYNDDINTWILEHTSILFPYDDFLNQKYPVDIIIDTGDANYDFVLNCVYPHYNGRIEDDIEDEAAILWLAKENGYSKNNLEAALKYEKFNGSKFLKSLRNELYNCTSHMNALAFFVEMSLKELIDFHSGKIDNIKLSKDTSVGLYDSWQGAGGVLEICLENDIYVPSKIIHICLPDGIWNYGIGDIYGCDNTLWERGDIIYLNYAECKEASHVVVGV